MRFDLFSKINVTSNVIPPYTNPEGEAIHPFFDFLVQSRVDHNGEVKWNFDGTWIVDKHGVILKRFTNEMTKNGKLSLIDDFVNNLI